MAWRGDLCSGAGRGLAHVWPVAEPLCRLGTSVMAKWTAMVREYGTVREPVLPSDPSRGWARPRSLRPSFLPVYLQGIEYFLTISKGGLSSWGEEEIEVLTDCLRLVGQAQLLSWGFAEESWGGEKRGAVTANGREGHYSCFLVPSMWEQHNTASWEFLIMKNELPIKQPLQTHTWDPIVLSTCTW